MDIDGWTFTKHAIERAMEMCLDGDEIREALTNPPLVVASRKYHGCHNIVTKRLMIATSQPEKVVITIGWNSSDGQRIVRYSRTLEQDLFRIRDN
jgi:hypothetical protein